MVKPWFLALHALPLSFSFPYFLLFFLFFLRLSVIVVERILSLFNGTVAQESDLFLTRLDLKDSMCCAQNISLCIPQPLFPPLILYIHPYPAHPAPAILPAWSGRAVTHSEAHCK